MAESEKLSDRFKALTTGDDGQPGTADVAEPSPAAEVDEAPPAQAAKPATPLKQLSEVGQRFVRVTDGASAVPSPQTKAEADPQPSPEAAATARANQPMPDDLPESPSGVAGALRSLPERSPAHTALYAAFRPQRRRCARGAGPSAGTGRPRDNLRVFL